MESEDIFELRESEELIVSHNDNEVLESAETESAAEHPIIKTNSVSKSFISDSRVNENDHSMQEAAVVEEEVNVVDENSSNDEFENHNSPKNIPTDAGKNISDSTKLKSNSMPSKVSEPKLVQLPLSKIRAIMKLDPDLQIASTEAVFSITKATEMFIESLAKESFTFTSQSKKKTIQKRDVTLAIASIDSLMFLEGAMDF